MNTNLTECFNCDRLYNTTVNFHCPICGRSAEKDTTDNTQMPTLVEAVEERSDSDNRSPETADD